MNDSAPANSAAADVTRFTDVDLTPDARFFVEFMDAANALPDNRRLKQLVADHLRLSPGSRVLDVGCGTGDNARVLALLIGETGRVVGIDASETMIGVARERSRNGPVAGWSSSTSTGTPSRSTIPTKPPPERSCTPSS